MLAITKVFIHEVPQDADGKEYLIARLDHGFLWYCAATDDKETAFKLTNEGYDRILIQRWRTI